MDEGTMISPPVDTQPSNLLRKFPPEIREHIFTFTLANSWEGKTPALLKALYGDREVYHEAIKVFYRTNAFFSSWKNNWADDFADHLLPTVTRWKIMIKDEDVQIPAYRPVKDVWRFARTCELEEIHFITEEMFLLDDVERMLFANQKALRKVEISFSSFWLYLSTPGMDSLDARFGVRGYLATVGTMTDVTIFWEAPKGQILTIVEPTTRLRSLLTLRPDFWGFYPPEDNA